MGALRPNVKSVFCFVLTSGEPANRLNGHVFNCV